MNGHRHLRRTWILTANASARLQQPLSDRFAAPNRLSATVADRSQPKIGRLEIGLSEFISNQNKGVTFSQYKKFDYFHTIKANTTSLETNLYLDVSFPLHSLQAGPIIYSTISLATKELNGPYLHFAYLQAREKEGRAVFDFAPSCHPSGVRFCTTGPLQSYAPTASREEMIATVEKEFGEEMYLPKPVRTGL